ncbi:MAG: hypothetical protein ABFS86_11085 [Planctomycetota bacterium]
MTRRPVLLLAALLVVLVLGTVPAFADKIYFKNGSSFEGKLIRETSTHYIFKVKGMGEQKFKKSEVLKVEKGESAFDVYEKRRKALADDDAKGWYELGVWCKEQSLRKEAKQCFRTVLKADDDHAGARQALGFVRYHGDWLTAKKYKKVAAETEAKESEIISGLKLGKEPVQDAALRYMIIGPAEWTAEKKDGEGVEFTGPELGGVKVEIELEIDAGDGEPGELVKELVKELGEENDGVLQKGDPKDCTLCGKPAKLVVTGWTAEDIQPWKVDVERRDIFMVSAQGVFHLRILCAAGYYERMAGTLDKVIASVKILDKAMDLVSEKHAFGISFPDDSYEKGTFLPLRLKTPDGKQVAIGLTREAETIRVKERATLFIVSATEKAEGTTLDSLQAEVKNLFNIPQMFQPTGTVESLKLDGKDAKSGEFSMANGQFAFGHWAVAIHGDRAYTIMYISMLGGGLGRTYLKKDWVKFLDGFRFM